MRYLLSLFVLLFILLPLKAQGDKLVLPLNSMSLNIFSVKQRQIIAEGNPYYHEVFQGNKYYPHYFHGVGYTRRFKKMNFVRLNFNYFQKQDEESKDYVSSEGSFSEIEFALGYQRYFFDYWVTPYVGLDLKILWGHSNSRFEDFFEPSFTKLDLDEFGYGFSPFFGLKFYTPSPVSFSLETSWDFLKIREQGNYYYWEPDIVPENQAVDNSKSLSRFNPVAALYITLEF